MSDSELAFGHGSDRVGTVVNVQRFSVHDGPGIRTVVFLKGCPLRCQWCSNPEMQLGRPEIEYVASRCVGCGRCVKVCPRSAVNSDLSAASSPKLNRQKCDGCGLCAEACIAGALRLVGKTVTVEQVMVEVRKDSSYYRRSGGGLTLSGGEVLSQSAFATGVLRSAYKENVSTAIETSGFGPWARLQRMLPFLDLVLFDVKLIPSAAHRAYTGWGNEQILDNLKRLDNSGLATVLRWPLLPGINMSDDNVEATVALAASLRHLVEVHLLPFHQYGRDKYRRLDRPYALADLEGLRDREDGAAQIHKVVRALESRGLTAVVGG